MTDTASRHIAIWIDHHEAILIGFDVSPAAAPMRPIPDDQWFQYRVDARRYRLAQGYYEAVLSLLEPRDEIFVLGPDQAQRELLRQIECRQGARGTIVGIHYAATLSDADLVCPTSAGRPGG